LTFVPVTKGKWTKMGLGRTILLAVVGPFLVYYAFLGHVVYRHWGETAGPIEVQDFPKDTPKELKDAMIAQRKPLVKDFFDAFKGKLPIKDFSSKWLTDDAEYEDPFCRFSGRSEFEALLKIGTSAWKIIGDKTISEHHGTHEILLDEEFTMALNVLPDFPMTIRSRIHFLLEPPSSAGGPEKLFRFYEEIGGNKLLNERTTFGPLGKVHSKLRRYVGTLFAMIVEKGWI